MATFADRVRETTTTTGTGTLNLAGAVTKHQTFVAGAGDATTVRYCIVHQTANEWEVGEGVVTDAAPDTLSRDTILDGTSGAGSAVSFAAGTKDVFLVGDAAQFTNAQTHIAASTVHGISGYVVGTTDTQILSAKTLTTPAIGDFTNATHDHSDNANAGTLPAQVPTIASEADGDLMQFDGAAWVRVAKGTDGQVLVSDGTDSSWGTLAGDCSGQFDANTVTDLTITSEADGDILQFDGTNWIRVAKGTDGQILVSDGTDPSWGTLAGDCSGQFDANTVTDLTITSEADGDLLQFDGANWVRVAKGTDGQMLVSDGTDAGWGTLAGDCSGQFDANTVTDLTITSQADGDLLQYDGANWVRVAKGTDGQVLKSDGTDVGWEDDLKAFTLICTDDPLTTGNDKAAADIEVPFACTIVEARANVKTAPTGAALTIAIQKSGAGDKSFTDAVTSANLDIDISAFYGNTTTITSGTLAKGACLRIDIDQVGSTVAGSVLTVTVIAKKT